MYFFDPVVGNRRRAVLRDQLYHLLNKAGDVADAKWRDAQNRLYGQYAELRKSYTRVEPSDQVLADRVRSAMGRCISHSGAIEVAAHSGVVVLSGQILADEVDDLICAVQSVPGVAGVEDHLEVHESASNISALQGSGQRSS
jgi:osmotically-inducible protein OsmY